MKIAHGILLICLILLTGCAAHTKSDLPSDVKTRWEQFVNKEEQEGYHSFTGSLRVGKENDTHRFNFVLHNGTIPENSTIKDMFSPSHSRQCLKMDIYTGMGGILSNIFVCDKNFLLYSPKENKLIFGEMTPINMRKLLDVALPMDFHELYALLFGRKAGLKKSGFPEECSATADGTILYRLNSDNNLEIGLDSEGRMISWKNTLSKFRLNYADSRFPKKINGNFTTVDGTILLNININEHKKLNSSDIISPEFPRNTPIYFMY